MKPTITWIVIADGDEAKVFENEGPGKGLKAVKDLHFEQESLKGRDIMADKPGRGHSSAAPGARSSMEYSSDPVAVRERRFVERLADVLDEKRTEGRFHRLIIAAAPTALGDLRPALSDGVRSTIMAEMPKDLTNTPTPDLPQHFAGVLAV